MEILFLILLFLILYPLAKIAFTIWRQVNAIKKQFGQFQEQFNDAQHSRQSSSHNNPFSSNDNRKNRHRHGENRFPGNVGEYVEFEEIICERTSSEPFDASAPYEPQISDAKFEDVE